MDGVDRPWTRVGAHGLCVADQRLLMVRCAPHLDDAGKWSVPGGGLEWGEAPEVALVREFREETGLDVTAGPLAGVFSKAYVRNPERPQPSVHFMSIVFWAEVDPAAELVHEAVGTSDQAAWIPIAQLHEIGLTDLGRYTTELVRVAATT
jgi:ADP-ribose pyrophosphatase YjhB (NUDIX family)